MQQFINENKQFLLTLCGGAAVFFICMFFIFGIFDEVETIKADIQTRQGQIERRLEKLNPPEGTSGLKSERALKPVLKKDILPKIESLRVFSPSKTFVWEKGTSNPGLYFTTKKSHIFEQLRQQAERNQPAFRFEKLGFSSKNVSEDKIAEYLMRLELVQLIIQHAIRSRLDGLTAISAEVPTTTTPIPGTRKAIVRLQIDMELEGENKHLLKFIAKFAQSPKARPTDVSKPYVPFLEVRRMLLRPSSRSQRLLRVRLRLAALRLKELKNKAGGTSTKGGKKRGWGKKSLIRKIRKLK